MSARKRLPYCGGNAWLRTAAERSHRIDGLGSRSVNSLDGAFLVAYNDFVAGLDALDAADVDYVSALGSIDCKA